MDARKLVGPLLALVVAAGVAGGIYLSAERKAEADRVKIEAARVVALRGLIGSEKEAFFSDPRVAAALRKHGLEVQVEKTGSRAIAQRTDLKNYDFGFPAGAPAAIKLQGVVNAKQTYNPFFTVMAVATWQQLMPVLEANGLVRDGPGGYRVLDMKRFLELAEKQVRWRDLKGNTAYATGRSVLINSTDVRRSNSAAMYLALASYLANDSNIVQTEVEIQRVLPLVSSLFLRQGLQESSTAGPFEDYVTMGLGKAPLVMIYEAQFLQHLAHAKTRNPDMVLAYPQPTIYTKHTLVPFTQKGAKLGEALTNDPELQNLAAEHGLRTGTPEHFAAFLKANRLTAPVAVIDVIEPPSYEVLERMIEEIEKKL
jgi:hypothetical protein